MRLSSHCFFYWGRVFSTFITLILGVQHSAHEQACSELIYTLQIIFDVYNIVLGHSMPHDVEMREVMAQYLSFLMRATFSSAKPCVFVL